MDHRYAMKARLAFQWTYIEFIHLTLFPSDSRMRRRLDVFANCVPLRFKFSTMRNAVFTTPVSSSTTLATLRLLTRFLLAAFIHHERIRRFVTVSTCVVQFTKVNSMAICQSADELQNSRYDFSKKDSADRENIIFVARSWFFATTSSGLRLVTRAIHVRRWIGPRHSH